MPTRLSLICHARTEAQRLGRFPEDEPAESKSLEKAGQLATVLKKPVRILCAPEIRTLQTAHALGRDIEIVPALEDYDFGDWRGQSLSELQESCPQAVANWLSTPYAAPHHGESVQDLCLRVGTWLEGFREEGHFAVVTHPFVIRAAILHALAASTDSFNFIDIEPLAIVNLRFNERWRLRF